MSRAVCSTEATGACQGCIGVYPTGIRGPRTIPRWRYVLPLCLRIRVVRNAGEGGRIPVMGLQTRILVVDDDDAVRALLVEYLGDQGFSVRAVCDGAAMRAAIEAEPPDLVLLDLRLPGEDGLTLARRLRETVDVGIVMVTASGDVIDRVVGLEMGADDYIAKPFDPRELLARVRSVLRRLQARAPDNATPTGSPPAAAPARPRTRFGRCEIDLEARRMFDLAAGGEEVAITAMEYDLVRVFLANANRVLSRDQLLMHTRNREWEPFDRSIDIRIGRLRRKVEPDPTGEPRCIRTVRNGGYMYIQDA